MVVASGCVAPAGRPRGEPPPRLDRAAAAADLFTAHNAVRARHGRAPLAPSEALSRAAQEHADDMAARSWMSHRGGDGASPFTRITRAGYAYAKAGENVAAGQPNVEAVMRSWLLSPGHRRNVLGGYSEIGTACAIDTAGTPYWCVTFGTPASQE